MEIGEIIKKQRKKHNISKSQLAGIVGCSIRAIDYWEDGKRNISLENADKIFKALNMTINIGFKSILK